MATLQKQPIHTSQGRIDELLARSTSACSRCGGLLVKTFCITPKEGIADFQIDVMKCLQCGDIVDPVILKNRFCEDLPNPRPPKKFRWASVQATSRSRE
jgi:hypothetical protein